MSLGKFVYDGFALLLFPVLKIIKIWGKIVFCPLRVDRIGHFASETELFLRRLKNGNYFDKNNHYIGISNEPCNRQLFKMFQRVFPIIENRYLFQLLQASTILQNSEFVQRTSLRKDLPENFDDLNKLPPVISFSEEEEERGKKLLAQMGIGENDWFVCFHSRDESYLNTLHKGRDWYYHDYRNTNIDNYLKAAEYIAEKGGFAIRMGSLVSKPLPKDINPKIIDYAVKYRSEFMDIYLLGHCKFFLGSTAGICFVSTIFEVPVVCANFVPLEPLRRVRKDIFIPKKIYSNKEKRFLAFKEILNSDVCSFSHTDQYKKNNLTVVENTVDEILAVTKEMYERLSGKWSYSEVDENLQKWYHSFYRPQHTDYTSPVRIGTSFLRENKELLT